ncbi:MAG: hypothetical protein EXR22_06430 [Flavobacteriaceae bacterium]|nr:hypothetical protein [Flavobacteriaceae bacterium]
MRTLVLPGILVFVASCGVPKDAYEAQVVQSNRLRSDSLLADQRLHAVRDSLSTLDSWAGQSEQALIELALELELRTQELAAMQVRADSLQERVLKNASQRDVWRLERLASERAMLKANRKSDSLQEVVLQLQSAKKRR